MTENMIAILSAKTSAWVAARSDYRHLYHEDDDDAATEAAAARYSEATEDLAAAIRQARAAGVQDARIAKITGWSSLEIRRAR